jgi:site-specific recombinase XerD
MLPGLDNIIPSASWQEAWDGFELHLRSLGRARKTIDTRRSSFSIMSRWATKSQCDPEHVTQGDMRKYLVRQFNGRKGTGAAVLYQDLRCFWDWYSAEYGTASPMDGISRPQGKSRMTTVLRPDDIAGVLAACKTSDAPARDTAIVWLLLESGLRRFELAALSMADVDLKARTVTVRCGKGGKARIAVMGDESAQALWRWLRQRSDSGEALFTSRHGGRLTPGGISQIIKRIGDTAGLHLHPHAFRHAWAHYSLDAGASETNLMEVAGWSSRRMLDRYGAELKQERAIAAMKGLQVGQIIRGK